MKSRWGWAEDSPDSAEYHDFAPTSKRDYRQQDGVSILYEIIGLEIAMHTLLDINRSWFCNLVCVATNDESALEQ